MQQILAIARLTLKAAFRFRLVLVLTTLMLLTVVGLPLIIKDDGSARGMTQILLTYTLGSITSLLGFATLWLACGTLARDVEECQMQVVAVKPVSRWKIWFGKWLGIMMLNGMLLCLAGLSVYLLIQWRAKKLPPEQQEVLRNEVLVGRGSAKEEPVDYEPMVKQLLQERLKEGNVAAMDREFVKQQIRESLKAQEQVVPPNMIRRWQIDMSDVRHIVKDKPLHMRVKFIAGVPTSKPESYLTEWHVGPLESPKIQRSIFTLPAESFHEIALPPNLLDENGILTIEFWNRNPVALLFPLDDGMEVLYRESGFGLNFARGLGIIYLWIGLMAALGLAAASYMAFPVAAFFSIGMLMVAMSSGVISTVVQEGTVLGVDHESGLAPQNFIDPIIVPLFKALSAVVNMVRDFSPIDSLSSGRSITWGQLGRAFTQIGLVMSGFFCVVGMVIFTRRELATAQGKQ